MPGYEYNLPEGTKHEQGEKLLGWVKKAVEQLVKSRGRAERLNQRDQEVVLNNPSQILRDLVKYCQLPPDQRPESFEEVKRMLENALPEGKEIAEKAAFIAATANLLKSQGYKCELPHTDLMGKHDIALSIDLTPPEREIPLGSRKLLVRIAHGLPVNHIPKDAKIMFTYPEEPFEKLILPENIALPNDDLSGMSRLMKQRPRSDKEVFFGQSEVVKKWRGMVNESWNALYRAADDEAKRLNCDPEEIDTALLCVPDLRQYPFLVNPDTGDSVEFFDGQVGETRNNLDELLAQGMVMNNYHPVEPAEAPVPGPLFPVAA